MMKKAEETGFSFLIDKLTRSIENVVTGDSFPTEISIISTQDFKSITKKNGWLFAWKTEFARKEREIYKLTIINNPSVIQGLISLAVRKIIYLCISWKMLRSTGVTAKYIQE